jgi:flagellar motility protein MotE (MotC chaperone)
LSPNHDTIEKVISSINAFGADRLNHPSRQEHRLRQVVSNKEEKLEVLEARRKALLQELDHLGEEIVQTRAELDKAKSLL